MPVCKHCLTPSLVGSMETPVRSNGQPVFICAVCKYKADTIVNTLRSNILGIKHIEWKLHLISTNIRFIRVKFKVNTCQGECMEGFNFRPSAIITTPSEYLIDLLEESRIRALKLIDAFVRREQLFRERRRSLSVMSCM